jgi:Fic family protein
MTSFIDAMIIAKCNDLQKRIDYLTHQLAAKDRLDGWTAEGHEKELKKLKKELEDIINNRD